MYFSKIIINPLRIFGVEDVMNRSAISGIFNYPDQVETGIDNELQMSSFVIGIKLKGVTESSFMQLH